MFTRVEARHYKILKRVDVPLEPINILVGPNASGKSTLLDVFAFLQAALRDDVERAVRQRARSLRELVWCGENEAEGFELAVEMALPDEATQIRYELKVGLDDEGALAIHTENLFLIPRQSNPVEPEQQPLFPFELPDEHGMVVMPSKRLPLGWRAIIRRGTSGATNYKSETKDWTTAFKLPPLRLGLGGIPEDAERFPKALSFRETLLNNVQFIQLNSSLMQRTAPADAQRRFQVDGSNLPIVIAELKRTHPPRFDWWLSHVQTFLPDIEGIDVAERPEDNARYLKVRYRGGLSVPAWLLSDGTLRLLALTLIAYLPPESGGLYMIEEPENGVHPRALEAIFASLSSAHGSQMLMATHSALLLAQAKPEYMLVFGKTENGASAIVRGTQHPMLQDWRSDTSLGALLAEGVLE